MKYIIVFIALPFISFSQVQDSIYPVKLIINKESLICLKPSQAVTIAEAINDLENCQKEVVYRDSSINSLTRETNIQQNIISNDAMLIQGLTAKTGLYESIIKEKDLQLKLKDREKLVTQLKSSNKNYSLEILLFLTGGLIGYALHK